VTGKFIVAMPWKVYQGLLVGRHEWGTVLRRKHGYDEDG
jgi:hypothetical protein